MSAGEFSHTWEEAVAWLREQPGQEDLVRACYFDDPLPAAAERFWRSEEWSRIRGLLPEVRGRVLDLGAGRGISSYALARDGWNVTALEPDPSELVGAGAIRQVAAEAGVEIEVVTDYSETLPFEDASFDLVHCRQVLHHARDLAQTCREIFRVLKPGGVMVATREHVISRPADLQQFLDSHPLHHLYGGEHAFLLAQYTDAMKNAGLDIRQQLAPFDSPINYFPMSEQDWVAICTQPLARLIGRGATARLFSREHGLGNFTVPVLARLVNWRNQTPGRLYSFVAERPARPDLGR